MDKSSWAPGPWQDEPDRLEFSHAGLPCLLHRNQHGAWCGYAAVPPSHPLHGKHYDTPDVSVHGGLTYGRPCSDSICHVPAPGEPDDVWWFGFDCAHFGDLVPHFQVSILDVVSPGFRRFMEDDVYRDMAYVKVETERLAEQLAGATKDGD